MKKEFEMKRRQIELSPEFGKQRRKFVGIMSLSALGLFVVNSFPFRFFSRKINTRQRPRDQKVAVKINDLAVKRARKVI